MRGRAGPRRPMGVRGQMALGFVLFALAAAALLWVFQIFLIRPFYQAIKTNEAKAISGQMVRQLGSEDGGYTLSGGISDAAYALSAKTGANIYIFDHLGRSHVGWRYSFKDSLASGLTQREAAAFFEQVNLLGGGYSEIFQPRLPGASKLMVYAATTRTPGGYDWLVVVETEITMLDSTLDTLVAQLVCITLILAPLGAFFAVYIPRRIARPLTDINEAAKRLGRGDYAVRFEQRGAREVSELAGTLNFAAQELSKTEGLRRDLLANVSHDLRTPLTMIKGYAEVMRDLPGENTPENVQIIIDEAGRLNDLVNDLLDLSRLEAGVLELQKERFNLTENVREILGRYDKLADFSFPFYAGEDAWVLADRLKISQVVYNLVNNAVNYCGEDKTITLRQEVKEGRVRVSVADTGEGIPPDKLQDIWERYYKVDREHRRAQVGTGLGLSIVKNVLDLHGGTYGVISELGKGSTFWFELELDQGDSPEEA